MTEDIQFVCGACEKDYEGDSTSHPVSLADLKG
jgi:hypothetical protein